MLSGRRFALRLAAASLLVSAGCFGQTSELEQLYADGAKAMAEGRWNDSVEIFTRIADQSASAPALFNLGQSEAKLGRLLAARAHLRRAKALAQEQGPPNIADLADAALNDLELRIPRVVLELPGGVESPEVRVDGQRQELEGNGLLLDPGDHRLEVTQPGRRGFERDLKLKEGAREKLVVELPVTEVPPLAPEPQIPERRSSLPIGPLVLGGAGAAVLLGGVFFYLREQSIDDERRQLWEESGCPGRTCPSEPPPRELELRDDARSAALVGNVLVGVGAAALVGAGGWWWLSRQPAPESERGRIWLELGVKRAAVHGRF